MQTTTTIDRRTSPAKRPHPLAFHKGRLWTGSWETDAVYAIDPQTWTVVEQHDAPGRPYGIAALGDELRVVISLGDDDDRYLFRFVPGSGFDLESKAPCPDFTGSYLASDGRTLYLGQMHNRRIAVLDGEGGIARTIALPTPRTGGLGFGPGGRLFTIGGDDEMEHLQLGTIDAAQAEPAFEAIAPLPDEARSLAYDGTKWWTCLRDADEIGSFNP